MATKKIAVTNKPAAKKVVKGAVKTAKKSVKAAAKSRKVPMVPTVDTFKPTGNGKLKVVAPKAKPTPKKTITVVVKFSKGCPCKNKKDAVKRVTKKASAKKTVAAKAKSKKTK